MSEEMAVSDNATGEDANAQTIDTALEDAVEAMDGPAVQHDEEMTSATDTNTLEGLNSKSTEVDQKTDIDLKNELEEFDTKLEAEDQDLNMKHEVKDEFEVTEHKIETLDFDDKKGVKRRASDAFSDDGDEFKGFDVVKQDIAAEDYSQVLERLEAEVSAASKCYTPVRHVMGIPGAPVRASKRPRKDTGMSDGSRPSSAQSSRSEDDNPSSSPAHRGRRPTTEMSSPLLRVPLERGWKRELVYRAALDAYSRRNADIYYYTPQGKKLRSTREVSEHLSGTGLTLENFSFFKEPLGVDDPEKEIIRDAKLIRRMESPGSSPAQVTEAHGKRIPKPKPPKGASPEPVTPKSPPAKLKVKSLGSRVSSGAVAPKPVKKVPAAAPAPPAAAPAPASDNNNTASWKKPRAPPPAPRDAPPAPAAPPTAPPIAPPVVPPAAPPTPASPPAAPATPPQNRPATIASSPETPRVSVQPCSLACGAGVPSLSCVACLCMYHPACAGLPHTTATTFLCKVDAHLSEPNRPRFQYRILIFVAFDSFDAFGKCASTIINNDKRVSRVSNGATPACAPPASPRRRGRPRATDDPDYFTPFCKRAQESGFDVALQIFQYLGMRDLARCARVCKLWRQLAATPALWRHVRMKNSHVSDWGGLCAALKRHGTKWLDLRKMLLPQNDGPFWDQFIEHIGSVESLERLELCRCPARAVEGACGALRALRALSALAVRDALLDPRLVARAAGLTELRLKSLAGLALAHELTPLGALTQLTHLSLTSIKELGWRACEVLGSLPLLEALELGECTFRAQFAAVLARLTRLRRLRLERGTAHCAAPDILRAVALLPHLTRLELVNIDVKVGFDDALAECKNVQRLLIIPTYVSQSATTNKQVLSGVLRLKETLTHLMWGVTIELLRVTELFIDQCSAGGAPRRDLGECIPVLKPVPGCRLPMDHQLVAGPPQVEILPLPTLQRLLSAQLPNTKLKLLRIPFHATWRQSLADFQ